MPTAQPPGRKSVRPIRAPNAGNGGGRLPPVNGQNNNQANQQPNVSSNNKSNLTKSALKFAFMPEIGRSLEGVKLAWHLLINLVAQIYVVVKLIPENHPCADFRNASEYKLKDIIKIAYNSLKWEKSQVPQIIIFFAVLLFLLFIALSLITLVLNVGVNVAHAADTPGNSANDILNSIFNLQGSGMIPTAFGAMLRAYSNIILVLAGIILLYLIMQYVVESARHGQPGGKSFNHAWAPVRMVFALGLLIPLSSGLNSGQYITLYLAKWGSDMASNVYKQFAVSLQNGQGITASQVTVQPQKALANLFNLEACLAEYNTKYPSNQMQAPQIKDEVDQSGQIIPNRKIIDFSGTTLGDVTGCGKIHLYDNPSATNPNEILLNQQAQFFSANLPAIQKLAQDYISHYDPQSTNYYQAIQTSDYSSQMASLANAYSQQINSATQTAFSNTNIALGQDMQQSINGLGWVTAPTWLQRIANRNSEVADAEFSLPNVTNNSQDYAGMATGKTSAPSSASNPQEIESWKQQTASKAIDIGQNAMQKIFGGTIPQLGPQLYKSLIMDASNPFCSLVAFGKTLFRAAEAAYMGWLEVVTALGLSATSIMGNQINVGEALLQSITPMVTAFIGMTFMTGMMLGFMLPLIPTIRFIFAVLGWIIMVFVAVMGMPLFALAHLKTGGEGWIGSLQVAGAYNLLIGIIIRPTLIILGFIASLIVFNSIMKMAGTLLYASATSDVSASLSSVGINSYMNVVDALDPLAQVIKIFIFSGFVQAVANACFKLVDIVPSQAMTWMGTGAMSSAVEGGADEATQLAQGLGQQMNSAIGQRLPTAATNRLRDMQQLRTAPNRITPANSGSGEEKDEPTGSQAAGGKSGGQPAALAAPQSNDANILTDAGKGQDTATDTNNSNASASTASAVTIAAGTAGAGAAMAGGAKTAAATSSSAPAAAKSSTAPQTASANPSAAAGKADSSTENAGGNQAAQTSSGSSTSNNASKTTGGGYLDGAKTAAFSAPWKNPSAKDFGGMSQKEAIGWGIAKGAMRAFIPGGWMMGNAAKNNLRDSVKNAAAEGFYKSEESKANQSATGGTVNEKPEQNSSTQSSNQPNLSDPNNSKSYDPGGALYGQPKPPGVF